MNLVCVVGEHYSVYETATRMKQKIVPKHLLTVRSPDPLDAKFVEFMRNSPEAVRRGESPEEPETEVLTDESIKGN